MKYGLVGKDLTFSLSKEIHTMVGKYEYELYSMPPEDLDAFFGAREFPGLNVTMPYKKDVLRYCDKLTPLAKRIGAVNTIFFEDDKMFGDNTDYPGFTYMAYRGKVNLKNKNVLILGNGGAAAMAKVACEDQGCHVRILYRGEIVDGNGQTYVRGRDNSLQQWTDSIDVVVNATPVGKAPHNYEVPLVDLRDFRRCSGALDINYDPLRSALLVQAKELGMKYEGGMAMLVMQALVAGKHWVPSVQTSASAAQYFTQKLERKYQNVVLIGMGGSGKSSVAKNLGKLSGRPVVDTDREVEKREGLCIRRIFEEKGEAYFREKEAEVIREVSCRHGLIIATGGGAVCDIENMRALCQNGLIIYLDRKLEDLSRRNRPLYDGEGAVERIYAERKAKYEQFADFTFSGENDMRALARKINRMLK